MIENFITVSITDYCNFRCFDCPMARYRRSEKHTSTENLDAGKFEQVLLDCFSPADTAIEITGGEPTLVDKFYELMEMLSRRGFPTTVLTNCSKIADIPKYDNLRIIGSWWRPFMSLEYLKDQISKCRNDLYMALYVNREDREEMQQIYSGLGVKQIVGSWNDNDEVIKSLGFRNEDYKKYAVSNNVICKCLSDRWKIWNIGKYDGSEKAREAIRSGYCSGCEYGSGISCAMIYKTWQVFNGKEFAVDLSKFNGIPLGIDSIKTSCLSGIEIKPL